MNRVALCEIISLASGTTRPAEVASARGDQNPYPVFGGNGVVGWSPHHWATGKQVMIGRVGEKCGVVHFHDGPCWITDNALYVKEKHKPLDELFLAYLLTSLSLNRVRAKGGQPLVTQGTILSLRAFLPPLPEQRKIAEILGAWDDGLEKLDALIAAKERRKKGLVPHLHSQLAKCARVGHAMLRLGDLLERVTRRNTVGDINVLTISAQDGLMSQGEYFKRTVAGADLSKYYLLRRGEFAYNRSTSNGYPYGAIKRLDLYPTGVVSTLYLCFALKRKAPVISNYLCQYFGAGILNAGLRAIAKEGARAHGLLNVTVKEFFDLKIFLPPLNEQRAIADILDAYDAELRLLRARRAAMEKQKRGLMQRLLSGATRVRTENHD